MSEAIGEQNNWKRSWHKVGAIEQEACMQAWNAGALDDLTDLIISQPVVNSES